MLDEVDLKFVFVKYENVGGFMVEGGWYVDGVLGVLLVILGFGVVNVINVIVNVW